MKKCFLILIVALGVSCTREHPFLSRIPEIHDLATGSVLSPGKAVQAPGIYGAWRTELFGFPQSVSFIRVSPEAYSLDILCAEGEMADSTSALCSRFGVLGGVNGSYFNMRELTPVTYVKDDGFPVGSTSIGDAFRANGALVSRTSGVSIEACDTTLLEDGAWEAMASGPLLIDEGEVYTYSEDVPGWENFYNFRHPRTLIGMDGEGYVWLVVVDGRAERNAGGMTIAELTELSGMMGLTDALNLDGGGSSTLWTRSAGVLNHPSDNGRFDHCGQRVVPNVIAVR